MKNLYVKGAEVRIKSSFDLDIWNIKSNRGVIISARSFGQEEMMVTAQFGSTRVHIAHTHLEVINA